MIYYLTHLVKWASLGEFNRTEKSYIQIWIPLMRHTDIHLLIESNWNHNSSCKKKKNLHRNNFLTANIFKSSSWSLVVLVYNYIRLYLFVLSLIFWRIEIWKNKKKNEKRSNHWRRENESLTLLINIFLLRLLFLIFLFFSSSYSHSSRSLLDYSLNKLKKQRSSKKREKERREERKRTTRAKKRSIIIAIIIVILTHKLK